MAKKFYNCGLKLGREKKRILEALGGNQSFIIRECIRRAGPEILKKRKTPISL